MSQKLYLCLLVVCLLVACAIMRPERKCNVESMLLTESDFPPGTILNNVRSPIAEMPDKSAGFSANYGGSALYYEISRFPRTKSAENEFDEIGMRAFIQTEYEGPWETPPELSNVSLIFQKYYVACGKKYNGKYQCRMIGQYDEYYVFFFAYISDKGVTFDILSDLLQKIDTRMDQCLQK